MKRLSEYLFLGTLGGALYYTFEMLFRGFSHWSMFLLGGICFVFFRPAGAVDGLGRTALETGGLVRGLCDGLRIYHGIIVNKFMGWQVWDYTDQPFQLMGADLPAVYGHIFRAVRIRDPAERVSAPFPVRGKNAPVRVNTNDEAVYGDQVPVSGLHSLLST